MKKNIAFLIGSLSNAAGTERITSNLANLLNRNGYSITIISLCSSQRSYFPLDERIKTFSLLRSEKYASLKSPYIIYRLYKLIKSNDIEIIINVDTILALFTLPLKLLIPELKVISWEHFNYNVTLGVKRRKWARILSKKYADAIVTLTETDMNLFEENLDGKCKVYHVPNFIQNDILEHPLSQEKKIISVGRLNYQKGYDILIKIWAKVKSKIDDKSWEINILGDGEELEYLVNYAKKLKVNDSIKFLGKKTNVEDFYKTASFFMMTSRFEGLPMVLIEALNHGLPIISFNCPTGPADIVDNGINGYLIPLNDIDKYADKLIELMTDASLRDRMHIEALKKAKEFNPEKVLEKWCNILTQLEYDS